MGCNNSKNQNNEKTNSKDNDKKLKVAGQEKINELRLPLRQGFASEGKTAQYSKSMMQLPPLLLPS